ncbi:MAG: hypothetical protein ACOYMB_02795 [Patescibacteria group bacterium]
MKKNVFLALLVMIITSASTQLISQTTMQTNEQITILDRQIYQQRVLVNKLQDKVLEINKQTLTVERLKSNVVLWDSINNATGLTPAEYRLRKSLQSDLKKAEAKLATFDLKDQNLYSNLEAESNRLTALINRKRVIIDEVTLNKEVPTEVGVREANRRLRSDFVNKTVHKTEFEIKVQEEALKRLTSNTSVTTNDSLGAFTILLVNYSKYAKRIFSVSGKEGKRSYEVLPGKSILISALPQLYFCDIRDIETGNIKRGNYAEVSLQTSQIDGKKCSNYFIAEEYLPNGSVTPPIIK